MYKNQIKYASENIKCADCREIFQKDEVIFGSAAVFDSKTQKYGSVFWRHYRCVPAKIIRTTNLNTVDGFNTLNQDDSSSLLDFFQKALTESASPSSKNPKTKIKSKSPQTSKKSKKEPPQPKRNREGSDIENDSESEIDPLPKIKKKKETKEKKEKDPNAPHKPMVPYLLWSCHQRYLIKEKLISLPESEDSTTKVLSEEWKKTDISIKDYLKDIYNKNNELFKQMGKEYKETGTYTKLPYHEYHGEDPINKNTEVNIDDQENEESVMNEENIHENIEINHENLDDEEKDDIDSEEQ